MVLRRLHDVLDRHADGPIQGDFARRGAAGPVFDVFADGYSPLHDAVLQYESAVGQFPGVLGSFADEIRGKREDADDDPAWTGGHARADSAGGGIFPRADGEACAGGIRDVSAGEPWIHGAAAHPGPPAALPGIFREVSG